MADQKENRNVEQAPETTQAANSQNARDTVDANRDALIRIEGLGKVFQSPAGEIVALNNINIDISRGDVFGIIGLSGAGKSTLVRCINFLEVPTTGRVIIDGKNMSVLTQAQLLKARQSIGMIFQDFNLMNQRNAFRNVCFPMEIAGIPKETAQKKAAELLKIVGLEDRMKSFPSQLSGGQKQRVAIARALAMSPKVLLCDEATSALDPNTTRQILELLKKINQEMGVTIVVITHEMKVIETICNRVAVLDQSRIVEQGDVKQIFMTPKSAMARQLILPSTEAVTRSGGSECLRLAFDGNSAMEPIIANLALECRAAVSILAANTRLVDGKTLGQMIIRLPDDIDAAQRVRLYLKTRQIPFKEEELNDSISAD